MSGPYDDGNVAVNARSIAEQVAKELGTQLGVQSDSVASPSARYLEMKVERELPRALMGGTCSMRGEGTKYMPQHDAESTQTYSSRLNSTFLFNAYKDTVTRMASKFFTDPVKPKEDMPPRLAKLCDNIDGQGRALTPFLNDAIKEAMCDGISYVLVDSPRLIGNLTLADTGAAGISPYWVIIKADDLIGLVSQNINGVMTPVQVRIKECIEVAIPGSFATETKECIRVLEPNFFRVYEAMPDPKDPRNKIWILIDAGKVTFGKIPLVAIYTNRIGFMEGEPPLQSLAEQNQEHWVSSSEQRRALMFLRFAMLALIGVKPSSNDDEVEIGPDKVLELPAGGDAKYIEHNGSGIEAGLKDLQAIETRMRSAGMTLRIEGDGQVTATATAIDSDDTNAGLKAVAKGLADSTAIALQFTAEMMGEKTGGHVQVFDNFANSQAPGTIAELIQLQVSGNISKRGLWVELGRRGMLSEDFDPDAEESMINDETAKAMVQMQKQMEMMGQPGPTNQTTGAEKPEPIGAQ